MLAPRPSLHPHPHPLSSNLNLTARACTHRPSTPPPPSQGAVDLDAVADAAERCALLEQISECLPARAPRPASHALRPAPCVLRPVLHAPRRRRRPRAGPAAGSDRPRGSSSSRRTRAARATPCRARCPLPTTRAKPAASALPRRRAAVPHPRRMLPRRARTDGHAPRGKARPAPPQALPPACRAGAGACAWAWKRRRAGWRGASRVRRRRARQGRPRREAFWTRRPLGPRQK